MADTPESNGDPSLDATRLFVRSDTASHSPAMSAGPQGRVAIVSGKQASRSDQELNTLRARLRAATIVILFGFAIYLVRSYFDNRPLQGFHTLVVVALTGFVGVLSSRVDLSLTHLRCIELGIFGLPVAFFLPYHYFCILQQAEAQDPVGLVAIFQNVSSYWFCLLVIYGLFVPNHWKRAAIVVTPMVLLPIAAGVAAGFANPLVAEHLGFRHLSDTMMVLSIGALCASYGAEVISSLRQEADEARQFGQYRLQEQLGKGGMGEVYKAEHRLLKRPCAIKLIRPEHAGDPHMLARFEREVRTTAKLTHWNTIDIYDYGRTDEGTFYYVMEYLPGKSLRDVIAESSTIPPERAVHLLCQVCDALSEAHAQSFIHRDINPNNIFVTSRGGVYDVAKLLDFGLVKSVASGGGDEANLTMTGTVTGTPKYMAPEQSFSEGEPHVCSDIYSLGAVAYAMLTGYPPFDGANVMAIIMAHARDPVRRPTEINNKIPEELEQVVLKCLEKRPEDRFPTAESLREALQACPLDDSWTQHAAASWWREVEESASTEPDATEPAALPNE